MEVEGSGGGLKPEWAIADARQSGKLIAAAMLAALKLEKNDRESVLLLGLIFGEEV